MAAALYQARVGDIRVRLFEAATSSFAIVVDENEVSGIACRTTDFAEARTLFLRAIKLAKGEPEIPPSNNRTVHINHGE